MQTYRAGAEVRVVSRPLPMWAVVVGMAMLLVGLAAPLAAQNAANAASFAELKAKFDAEKTLAYNQRLTTLNSIANLKTDEAAKFLLEVGKSDPEVMLRRYALSYVGRTEQTQYIDALIAIYKNDTDPTLRSGAIEGLGNFGADAPIELLAEAAADENMSLANAGITALTRVKPDDLGVRLRDLIDHAKGGPYILSSLMSSLAREKHRDTVALCKKFLAEWDVAQDVYRERLVDALVTYGIDAEVAELLIHTAGDAGQQTAAAAAGALHKIEHPDAVAKLVAVGLPHANAKVRQAAAAALAKHAGNEGPCNALIEQLKKERETDVIVALIEALVSAGPGACERAFEPLSDQLRTREELVKIAAIHALGYCKSHAGDRSFVGKISREARGRDEGPKAEAIIALARLGIEDAIDIAKRALSDRSWRVRAAAITALEISRKADAIGLLIERLADEDGRLKSDIVRALHSLTGKTDLPSDATIWRAWWNRNKDGFVVPPAPTDGQPMQPGGGASTGFYGLEVNTKRVTFVLDVSGSMSAVSRFVPSGMNGQPTRLDVAKHELLKVLSSFEGQRDVKFNIIFFHTTAEPWKERLVTANAATLAEARDYVNQQQPRGGTNIFDPMEIAMQDPEVDTIFLLTDGSPGSGKFIAAEDICREIAKINRTRRIVIHTIGIQVAGAPEQFLKDLATQNHGQFIGR